MTTLVVTKMVETLFPVRQQLRPEMSEEQSPTLEDILKLSNSPTDHLDRELHRDEVNRLVYTIRCHITPILEYDTTVFVLGSYSGVDFGTLEEGEKWKLEGVRGTINLASRERGSAGVYAFLMDDVPGGDDHWIDAVTKFRILADISDCILVVTEHDKGGAVFEQGMILMDEEYREKTILMKREYANEEEEKANYSWMQSKGFFSNFDGRNKLITWEDPNDLLRKTTTLYTKFGEKQP